jgi:hypothetical protein
MSCEFINTEVCKISEGIASIKANLGEIGEAYTPRELREIECNAENDTARKKDCPTFQIRHK